MIISGLTSYSCFVELQPRCAFIFILDVKCVALGKVNRLILSIPLVKFCHTRRIQFEQKGYQLFRAA